MEKDRTIIEKRLRRATAEFKIAKTLANDAQWDTATNRLYYAAFYAVTALLLSCDRNTVTHKGVISVFGEQFIKTGRISADLGKIYSQLFQNRQRSDYDDAFDAGAEDIMPYFEPVSELIQAITEMIEAQNPS